MIFMKEKVHLIVLENWIVSFNTQRRYRQSHIYCSFTLTFFFLSFFRSLDSNIVLSLCLVLVSQSVSQFLPFFVVVLPSNVILDTHVVRIVISTVIRCITRSMKFVISQRLIIIDWQQERRRLN